MQREFFLPHMWLLVFVHLCVCKNVYTLFFSGNKQLCSRDVAYYSLGSTIDGYSILQSSVQRESHSDVFCIQSQNGESFTRKTLFIMCFFVDFLCEELTIYPIPLTCIVCSKIVWPESTSSWPVCHDVI